MGTRDRMNELAERIAPFDVGAEKCVLASLMLNGGDRDLWARTVEGVNRESFYQPDHCVIFDVLTSMYRDNSAIDAVLVRAELEKRTVAGGGTALADIGGVAYLGEILNSVPSAAHGPHYAAIVRTKGVLRSLIRCAHDTVEQCYQHGAEPGLILQQMIDRLAGMHVAARGQSIVKLSDALMDVYDKATSGGVPLTALPFAQLNDWLGGGIGDGEYVIVAGWPSHGKSALTKQIGAEWAGKGIPGGIVALEESRHKIARNILSAESGVPNKSIRAGTRDANECRAMSDGMARLGRTPLYICDTASRLAEIQTAIDLGVARHGWRWAVIDHADLIDLSSVHGDGETAKHNLISRTVKFIAKRLNIPVFLVKQLRKPEGHAKRKPTPGDLRQSGAYHQDADVILLVDSDDVHHRDNPGWDRTGLTDVILPKAREGTGGTTQLRWDGSVQRYADSNAVDVFA
jgi:replicative DNA helicase